MPIYDLHVDCNNLFRALHIILRILYIKKQLSKRHIFSGELDGGGGELGREGDGEWGEGIGRGVGRVEGRGSRSGV